MRTCFDIDEQGEYRAARALLTRRCQEWAAEHDRPADALLVRAALDSRHFSTDGRLTYWTPRQVRRYLLEWVPRHVDSEETELSRAPEVLRTLLRFIADYGLRDPRGALPAENEAAVDSAAAEFPAALTDPTRLGAGKFWGRMAREHDVDVNDPAALERFQDEVDQGRIPVNTELLQQVVVQQFEQPVPGEERALAQLPVHLPPEPDLREAAGASDIVRRIQTLVSWVGPQGRALTNAGRLRLAEARQLARELDLHEEAGARARSSAELSQVDLLVNWACRTRLVRRYRGRLVAVSKARAIVDDPLALWQRLFAVLEDLGDVVCAKGGFGRRSLLYPVFDDVVSNILNSLYSLPEPMPLSRLEETVWQHSYGARYGVAALPAPRTGKERDRVVADLERLWHVMTGLAAADRSFGVADGMFAEDLTAVDSETGESLSPFDPETSTRLIARLREPGGLMWLTDLCTAVLRQRMLSEGREAGLVGELAAAEASEMLGVVTQHYPPQSKVEEVAGWLSRHDTSIETLLDVARVTPLRSRAAAILELLCDVDPSAPKLLRRMRSDPRLAPAALVCLVETGTLDMQDLTEPERQLITAESSLRLLEMDGPEAIINGLGDLPDTDAMVVLDRIMTSGHPDEVALEEFRSLVVTPMIDTGAATRHEPPPQPPPGRLGTTRRERIRRRGQA